MIGLLCSLLQCAKQDVLLSVRCSATRTDSACHLTCTMLQMAWEFHYTDPDPSCCKASSWGVQEEREFYTGDDDWNLHD